MKKKDLATTTGIDFDLFGRSCDSESDAAEALMGFSKKLEALGFIISDLCFQEEHGSSESLSTYGEELGGIIMDYSNHIYRIAEKVFYPIARERDCPGA